MQELAAEGGPAASLFLIASAGQGLSRAAEAAAVLGSRSPAEDASQLEFRSPADDAAAADAVGAALRAVLSAALAGLSGGEADSARQIDLSG